MKIVILTTSPNSKATELLIQAGEKRGHQVTAMNPDEMYVYISNVHRKDRLYYKDKRIFKKEIDAVITRIGASKHARAVITHLRQNMGIYTTQTVSGISNAADKLKTTQLLSLHGIKTPKTIYAKETVNPEFLIEQVGGLPVIVKGLTGSQGANVIILETVLSANSVLESYYKSKQAVLIQEYIKPDKSGAKDIRAIVVGGKVVTAMQRIAPKGSFKSNVSLGAEAVPYTLTNEQEELSIKAAEAVGLDTAGVDIMTDNEGVNYVIEVNSNHGWKIQDVVKEDIAAAYIEFCELNYNKPDTRDRIINSSFEKNIQKLTPDEVEIRELALNIFHIDKNNFMSKAERKSRAESLFKNYGKEKVDKAVELMKKFS